MFGWGAKRATQQGKQEAKAPTAQLPDCLRGKLVLSYGQDGQEQRGLLKRSSTDDLVRPGSMLGKGTFGVVKLRHDKHTGECRAVKTIEKPPHWDRTRLVHEAIVMQNLDHPHLARLFGWHESFANQRDCFCDSVTMVMEFCGGGEFIDAVNNAKREGQILRESWQALAFKQMFEAMAYCQSRGLVHMDIKGGNILLLHQPEPDIKALFDSAPHVVIADLGLALVMDQNSSWFKKKVAGDAQGTPATMAPEVWRGDIGPKADMWGLGCILYETMCSRLPYFPADPSDKRQKTWESLYKVAGDDAKQRLEVCDCSEEAKTMCMRLLTVDNKDRPTAKDCVQNPWFARFLPAFSMDDKSQMCEFPRLAQALTEWPKRKPIHKAFCVKLAAEHRCASKFAHVFALFDTDRNGVLSKVELMAGLARVGVEGTIAPRVADALDYNSDGMVEYVEFSAACLSSLGDEYEEALRQEFGQLDSFGADKLTKPSFRRMLDKLKPICDPHLWAVLSVEDVLESFGVGRDGGVTFLEFAATLGGKPLPQPEKPSAQPKAPAKEKQDPDAVEYLSKSHQKWIDTTILERRDDGCLQLAIKPGYWFTKEDQKEQIRQMDGRPFVPRPKKISRKASTDSAAPTKTASAASAQSAATNASAVVPKAKSPFQQAKAAAAAAAPPAKAVPPKPKAAATSSIEGLGPPIRRKSRQVSGDLSGKSSAKDRSQAEINRITAKAFTQELTQELNFDALPPFLPAAGPSVPPCCRTASFWVARGLSPNLVQSEAVPADLGCDGPPPPPDAPPELALLEAIFEVSKAPPAPSSPRQGPAPSSPRQGPAPTPLTALDSPKEKGAKTMQNGQKSPQNGQKSPRQTTPEKPAPPTAETAEKRGALSKIFSSSTGKKPKAKAKAKGQKISAGSDVFAATPAKAKAARPPKSAMSRNNENLPPKEIPEALQSTTPVAKFNTEANDKELEKILARLEKIPPVERALQSRPSFLQRLSSFGTAKAAVRAADEWQLLTARTPLMSPGQQDGKPIIVIDWDDTFMPTTFIQRDLMASQPAHMQQQLVDIGPTSKHYDAFMRHAIAVEGVMRACKKVGNVAILTLAKQWWVDASVEKYFPGVDMQALIHELDICTYHADREAPNVQALAAKGQDASVIAKRSAFSACLKDFYGEESARWNVMSVGDAMVEHDALRAVLAGEADSANSKACGAPFCKTVKLMDSPSLQDLTRQLEFMLPSIRVMAEADRSFHRELS